MALKRDEEENGALNVPAEDSDVNTESAPAEEADEGNKDVDPLAIDHEKSDDNPKPAKQRRIQKPVPQNVADKYKGQYDHVNLVTTFQEKNICRLCYAQPGGVAELRKHEEEAHQV